MPAFIHALKLRACIVINVLLSQARQVDFGAAAHLRCTVGGLPLSVAIWRAMQPHEEIQTGVRQ
jgi:hypothetical protein